MNLTTKLIPIGDDFKGGSHQADSLQIQNPTFI